MCWAVLNQTLEQWNLGKEEEQWNNNDGNKDSYADEYHDLFLQHQHTSISIKAAH